MNLEESNRFKDELEKNSRRKRTFMISIAACGIIIALIVILMMYINYQDSVTEKFFVNKKQISELDYKNVDGQVYVNLPQLAEILGYNYTKGKYQQYDGDEENSSYMQNSFEILEVVADEETFTKYLSMENGTKIAEIAVSLKSPQGYAENFKTEYPVKNIDGTLYAPLANLTDMFNVQVSWEQYRKRIYTLDYIVEQYQSSIAEKYPETSGYLENFKAMLYGYAIISDGSKGKNGSLYGVYSFNDGKEVIQVKYDDIKFTQNSKQFYITVSDGTMGILDEKGNRVIEPSEYNEISVIDDTKQLYLVKKNEEYGVIRLVDKEQQIVVYPENDRIGYDDVSKFKLTPIENNLLWLDKYIPVKKDNKFGLVDIDGEVLLKQNYDGFGYVSNAATTSGNEQSVLFIPPEVGISGIVINFGDLYGIFDTNTKQIVLTCVCSKIYAITKSGETTYYIQYDGEEINLSDFLEEQGLKNIDENGNFIKTQPKDESESDATVETENEQTDNQ